MYNQSAAPELASSLNALFTISGTSLAPVLIYYRYKYVVGGFI